MTIGLVGLGRMGRAIQARLEGSGHRRRSAGTATRVAMNAAAENGMTIAAHPRAVADGADTVISIITEDNGVRNVFRGKDGFLSGDVRGKLFIDMSTLQPMTGRELAPVVEAAGASADRVAGARLDPDRARRQAVRHGRRQARGSGERRGRCWRSSPARSTHMGPNGAGYAMKLAVNLGLAAYIQATAESLALGSREGLSMQQMLDVLGEAPTANGWFAAKKGLLMGEDADITLDLKTLRKDMMSAVATGALSRHRHAAVRRRADRAVRRGGAGLGRQGHRRARAIFPRAYGPEVRARIGPCRSSPSIICAANCCAITPSARR